MSAALDRFPDAFTALVVGANRGIGQALTQALAEHPRCGRVFALCRQPDGQRFPDMVEPIAADVTRESTLAEAANTVERSASGLHLVLYCAGVLHGPDGMRPERSLDQIDPAALNQSFQVNAIGAALVAKHFAPLATHKQHAVMGFLSARVGSISDNRLGGWYAYRASKAAENQFVRTLAIEMDRARGPICVALHPGTVDTDLSSPFQANVPDGKLFTRPQAAGYLLDVVGGLKAEDSGQFFAWDGQRIEW